MTKNNQKLNIISIKPILGHSYSKYLLGTGGFGLSVLIWWLLTDSPIAVTKLIPGPAEVFNSASAIGLNTLLRYTFATLARALGGFLGGAIIGIISGFILSYHHRLFLLINGVIESMRPVPPVALIPFFLLIFGFSEFGRILLVWLGVSFIFLVAVMEAVRQTPSRLIEAFATLGAPKKTIYHHIIIPYVFSRILGPARVALALSISLVVVSEFMGASYGLGYLINVAKVTFTISSILLASILLGVISGVLDWLLRICYRALMPWTHYLEMKTQKMI